VSANYDGIYALVEHSTDFFDVEIDRVIKLVMIFDGLKRKILTV
jgi:hypothetical protein